MYLKKILVLLISISFAVIAYAEEIQAESKTDEAVSVRNTGIENQNNNEESVEEKAVTDPFEPLNRVFFTFNDKLYFWVMKPVAKGYSAVIPEWGRIRVRNVFKNAAMPVRFINSILQLKMHAAAKELGRFMVNTTAGLGGMFDILEGNPDAGSSNEDLGQTLGVYGIGDGFYIVLPVLGPSSFRDAVGLAGDYYLYPVHYLSDKDAVLAIDSYERVNNTSLRIGEYEDLKESAVDTYTAVKDAYIQHRRSKVKE